MRCSCQNCGAYMVHAESLELGCVCPECGNRCKACLGTNSVVSRDGLKNLADDPSIMNDLFSDPDPDDAPGYPYSNPADPSQYAD